VTKALSSLLKYTPDRTVCADMASKKRYKSSEEVLSLLFSLTTDVSESEDDIESSDTEPSTSTTETYVQNMSHTSRSSPTFSEHLSDGNRSYEKNLNWLQTGGIETKEKTASAYLVNVARSNCINCRLFTT